MLCNICQKRPAQVTVGQTDANGNTVQQSICFQCAIKMNIGPVTQMLKNMGIPEEELEGADEMIENFLENADMEGFQPPSGTQIPLFGMFNQQLNPQNPQSGEGQIAQSGSSDPHEKDGKEKTKKEKKKKKEVKKEERKFLSKFATDLTKRARDGKIDRIIGRDREIARTVQILCRRTKNNPCLIGEP
ncbi:MAG: ATP-dependent Clp protease ATP-binding subunit, partial [Oscillospiraceae bacterium]|nr:ATP-dependent Clp protease ATP-binding subunit [Oscillospiraceae bacterium]